MTTVASVFLRWTLTTIKANMQTQHLTATKLKGVSCKVGNAGLRTRQHGVQTEAQLNPNFHSSSPESSTAPGNY